MLKIENVTRKFKKVKAINNTTLEFDNKGMVALLGPSGCGKTTILNTVGGLDKINKGKIFVDGKKISSKSAYISDKIRNQAIGYIFQDYKLVETDSVFDNVALVLKMTGLKDKKEIKKRVEYVLEKVGMLRFKRRPAGMLSGGEKQRVAIARAIVKNPKILLCDEPTGNLDSKNSLEVMKIIKSISKDKLVVIVTHEQKLAKFYADRIIEIKDGVVENDYKNDYNGELDYELESTVYLKDMHRKDKITDGEYNINLYMNEDQKFQLDIVYKHGNIYIQSKTGEKIEVVDETTNTEFVDDHYKTIKQNEVEEYHFDTKLLEDENRKIKYSSILNPISLIINGFKKVFDYPKMKKVLLIGFFASGGILMAAFSMMAATTKVDELDYIKYHRDYLQIDTKNINIETFNDYNNLEFLDYAIPGDSKVTFNLPLDYYYQSADVSIEISGSIANIEKLKEEDILYGKIPTEKNEIVIDEITLNKLENWHKGYIRNAGFITNDDLIGARVKCNNIDFVIAGISKSTNPSIFVNKEMYKDILISDSKYQQKDGIQNYDAFANKIVLKEGRIPTNDYEIIVPFDEKETLKLNKTIKTKINNRELLVVGYYTTPYTLTGYFTNKNTIFYDYLNNAENLSLMTNNMEETYKYFEEKNIYITNPLENSKEEYMRNRKKVVTNILFIAFVLMAIACIEIIFMIRASFLSRIKEVGTYRAIGVKKADIYKMFLGEIIAITTMMNLPAILFTHYALLNLQTISFLKPYIYTNTSLLIIVIIVSYIFNMIIGLSPVFTTIIKKPAAILARQDVD